MKTAIVTATAKKKTAIQKNALLKKLFVASENKIKYATRYNDLRKEVIASICEKEMTEKEIITTNDFVLTKTPKISRHNYSVNKLNMICQNCNVVDLQKYVKLVTVVDDKEVKKAIKRGELPNNTLELIEEGGYSITINIEKR